jgi:hypothetical protein
MKKILFVFVAGLIPALAVTNETYAQSSDDIARLTPVKDNYKFREIGAINNPNTIELNMVNTKAMKNFEKLYKRTNEKWYNGSDCIVAFFVSNGISYYIDYDRRGHWTGSLKIYQEGQMPKDIRKIVKQEYYDYKIFAIDEVEIVGGETPVYLVSIEDEKNIKQLRIQNGNMDLYHDFKRS